MKADLVILNGVIYTQTGKEIADTMAVAKERILYVGNGGRTAVESYITPETEVIDIQKKTIIPGLLDAHTHPVCIALTDWRIPLKNTNDLNVLLEEAKSYCEKHPKEEVPYFLGESYQLTMFDEKGPRKELLDQYISDRPARMQDFTDHSCWYNSMALKLMGIEKGKPDPECMKGTPTVIVRDADGEPTGWVLEMPADALEQTMYDKIGWHPARHATEKSITPFLNYLTACGVTGFADGFTEGEEAIQLFYELDRKGKLPFYYESMVLLSNYAALEETIQRAMEWKEKYETKHIHIRTIKFFLDGTNEIGDCASLEPLYTDSTGRNYGHINMETEELTKVMVRLNEAGLDLHLHIVCDRAFRSACDALEQAKEICEGDWKIRVTGAHCELVHPDDRLRPAELGMIINWTPHWSGGYFGDKAKDYLGQERFDTMYDFTQMFDVGTIVAMSSDVFSYKEANRADPFFGMQCGATRVDVEFPLDPKRYPESVRKPESAKLTVEQMMAGYTKNAAFQMRLENELGTIEEGKIANFVILNRNPYQTKPEELKEIKPVTVYFEGKKQKIQKEG